MIQASGRSDYDWSADYRLFSCAKWEATEVFRCLMQPVVDLLPREAQLVVASLDDTNIRKSGIRIPGVAYRRDPMSPPFQANLIRAQRFVQASLAVPFRTGPSPARAIPLAFNHAPSAGKLAKNASDQQKAAHREREKAQSLSRYGSKAITQLRDDLNVSSRAGSDLLMAVDGSYTNRLVLRSLPEKTHVIGRIRKDAVLHELPEQRQGQRGRPRRYGRRTATPEQIRQDDSIAWTSVRVFAAGREHDCDIKEVRPLLWRTTGCDLPLRLIVIRPLAYRRSKDAKLLYRQPAYLITTDLETPSDTLVQAYFWRWDIEVNHRDEKQLIGVGQAQVRSPRAAERAPAFAVACYSMLLIAAARAYGLAATDPLEPRPKWLERSAAKQTRLSTQQLLSKFRHDYRRVPNRNLPNFDHFATNVARHMKSSKMPISIAEALHYAMN